ncbi:MAG: hypothetical protein ACD_21C00212G0007 [uncultured bacterium]|nr:MAG: hypothetical protein ACD_21C00212G0007 [uncultured bacterium]
MQLFLMALALVFVLEGLLPFLAPHMWRRVMQNMLLQPDRTLRIIGLTSMLIGVGVLYLLH